MAWEKRSFTPPGLEANGDLSSSQFLAVAMTTTNNRVAVCSEIGQDGDGVLQNKPSAAGDAAEVMVLGVTKWIAGGTVTAGDLVKTDASGKCVTATKSLTGADVGDHVMGKCIEGASANEYATILIVPGFATITG